MASPATEVRGIVRDVLTNVFAADSVTILDDRMHPSMGTDGNYASTFPIREQESFEQTLTQVTEVGVQVYRRWDKVVDNEQRVDPATIEDWAHRFRQGLQPQVDQQTADVWFMRLVRIDYPPDPTGNMTRFEAVIQAWGQNAALLETA